MEPFSLQSPETIAKEYAGNKQKISQAAQMGILDPTAAVLAGMFIDRMRSASVEEQTNPPTVAEQVLMPGGMSPPPGSLPNMPPPQVPQGPPPMPAAGGLGLTPQGMQSALPAPPPQGAPAIAAEGGLMSIDVPDAMFDEPDSGSYAPGGIVGYAMGGMSGLYDDVEWQESRGNPAAVSPKGAFGVMQLMPGTSRDPGFGVTPMRNNSTAENRRVGQEYLDAMFRRYGDQKTALMAYNWGPGNVDKWIKLGRPESMVPTETRNYVSYVMKNPKGGGAVHVAEKRVPTDDIVVEGRKPYESPDIAGQMGSMLAAGMEQYRNQVPQNTKYRDQQNAALEQEISLENMEELRKTDMWETLAQIGFSMASSPSPYFLQALGQAATAALPGARASRKERASLRREGIKTLAQNEQLSNAEAAKVWDAGVTLAQFQARLKDSAADREQRAYQNTEDNTAAMARQVAGDEAAMNRTQVTTQAGITEAGIRAAADKDTADKAMTANQLLGAKAKIDENIQKTREGLIGTYGREPRLGTDPKQRAARIAAVRAELQRLARDIATFNRQAAKSGDPGMPIKETIASITAAMPEYSHEISQELARQGGASGAAAQKNVPAGVSQAQWNAMSPEERAEFGN